MEKHVYLVRHGQSNGNKEAVMIGPSAVLTDQGKEEARIVAERIHKIGVEALVSSSLKRTLETSEPISERLGLPVEKSDLFVEWRRPSHMYGKSWSDPEGRKFERDLLQKYATTKGYRHSDEENFEDLKERALHAIAYLEKLSAERICVVTHGIFLRALFGAFLLGTDFEGIHFKDLFWGLFTHNTGITYARRRDDMEFQPWRIISWNDSAHLG